MKNIYNSIKTPTALLSSSLITLGLSTQVFAQSYCVPSNNCSWENFGIEHVYLEGETNTLNNNTQCSLNGYGDYTNLDAPDLERGVDYTISLTTLLSQGDLNNIDVELRGWVDFNNDGDFSQSSVVLFETGKMSTKTQTFNFSIPVDLTPGDYRMRIRIGKTDDWVLPCRTGNFDGETEDYMISIIVPTPVKLASFEVSKKTDNALLNWVTVSEENNRGFNIEHSIDGKNWTTIGFIPTKSKDGNSSGILNYSFTDQKPVKGINYYRLKQVDIDGKVEYSTIQKVTFGGLNSTVLIYPNPAKNHVVIEGLNSRTEIEIINALGQVIHLETTLSNSLNLKTDQFPAGMYYINIKQQDKKNQIEKVMIRK